MGNSVKDRSLATPGLGEVRVTVLVCQETISSKTRAKHKKLISLETFSGGVYKLSRAVSSEKCDLRRFYFYIYLAV